MKDELILLSHGNGGEGTKKLITEIILKHLGNELLDQLLDSTIFNIESNKIAFTTDSFVVSPIFFNGGDIGSLSVYGTCNDLGVMGAIPLYLSLSLIIEEGLKIEELEKIIVSIKEAAKKAEVKIVTGDTKVVERGKGDKIFINTSGIGVLNEKRDWTKRKIEPEDLIIISGTIGDHGTAIMLERLGVEVSKDVRSDLSSIHHISIPLLEKFSGIKFMRDPTRGGVATVLNEVASSYNVEIEIYEDALPIKPWVKEASELLGIDPLYSANEGKILLIASKDEAEKIVEFLHSFELGKDASIIGKVKGAGDRVYLKTSIGTYRILDSLKRDILPRIC